jgi:hypothetical protein
MCFMCEYVRRHYMIDPDGDGITYYLCVSMFEAMGLPITIHLNSFGVFTKIYLIFQAIEPCCWLGC